MFDLIQNLIQNKYIAAIIIILITLVIAKIVKFSLKKALKVSSKTKTKLDDIIVGKIKGPLQLIILTIGFFIAFKYIYPDFEIGAITLESIFSIIWILAGALLVSRIITAFFHWYTEELQHKFKKKVDKTIFQFIRKVINIIIIILAVLAILKSFGVDITPMLAGLGIGGLAVALAFKDTLANFFAAIYITADKSMKIGDYIEFNDTGGYVQEIGWRTTRIKTWDGNYIIVPNSKIAESKLLNYDVPKRNMTFPVSCGVAYDSDLKKVERVSLDVARKILKKEEGGVDSFEPFLRFSEFGDSSINFSVFLEVKTRVDKFKVRHEFIKALKDRFKKEKIEIPFPQIDVHKRK